MIRHFAFLFQPRQGVDHGATACQLRASDVGTVFPATREPEHDGAGKNAQHDFRRDTDHKEADTVPALVLEHHAVNKRADHPGRKNHERVHHTLNQRQGYHVAVGHVTYFVAQDRTNFLLVKAVQQPLADGYQRVVLVPASGKGIGL